MLAAATLSTPGIAATAVRFWRSTATASSGLLTGFIEVSSSSTIYALEESDWTSDFFPRQVTSGPPRTTSLRIVRAGTSARGSGPTSPVRGAKVAARTRQLEDDNWE